jgi:4-amino-4-deoxy-L-arabinose transferase-like glycosyltransferase
MLSVSSVNGAAPPTTSAGLPLRLGWRRGLTLVVPFVAAVLLKAVLIPMSAIPFDSDEAIPMLMAKHILAGERPIFWYGEDYGGSLDSFLIAGAYSLLGASVTAARVVQSLEYLGAILFTYLLARRIVHDRFAALATASLMALPTPLLSLFTTTALLYTIVMLLGSMLLFVGHKLLHESEKSLILWLVFGALVGLAFWTFGILVIYILPVGLLMLSRLRRQLWPYYLLATLAFFLFSSPLWIYNFTHDNAALRVVFESGGLSLAVPMSIRVLLGFCFGLPTLFGFRYPWASQVVLPALAWAILAFYLAVLAFAVRAWYRRFALSGTKGPTGVSASGLTLLWLLVIMWLGLFFSTRFGIDSSGRYYLPLYTPLLIFAGVALAALRLRQRRLATSLLTLVLGFNLLTTFLALWQGQPGFTAQMSPDRQFDNRYDQALITFLKEHGPYGYSHHWITYKIAFLSDEQVILATQLPYHSHMRYNPRDDRYPPYSRQVAASEWPVYVTFQEPHLDRLLRPSFAALGVSYSEQDIGPYRVFYDLSAKVEPWQLQPYPGQPAPPRGGQP